jgi:diguanylate cyclase (GGDEF)-like protein
MKSKVISTDAVPVSCPLGEPGCQIAPELDRLRQEVMLLQQQARTDALTGLYNYRFFSDTLPLEMERARRSSQCLTLIILDVDHFKLFNDRWGHELGNQALVHIAQLVNATVRKLDYACRFGGEEFVLILPNTDLRQARNVAERLREAVEQAPIKSDEGVAISLTISLGVDEFYAHKVESAEDFLKRADTWLYQAKSTGRNCVQGPDIAPEVVPSVVTQDEKAALFSVFTNSTED